MLFANNLIVLLVIKFIPPAELAALKENEELINYSIILLEYM
jgi:hypothetical protein